MKVMDWIISHLSAYWDVMIGEMIMGGLIIGGTIILLIIWVVISEVIR